METNASPYRNESPPHNWNPGYSIKLFEIGALPFISAASFAVIQSHFSRGE